MLYNYFQNISFANIWVLPVIVVLPVIAWLRYSSFSKLKSSFIVSSASNFTHRTAKNLFIHFPFWLRLLALGCLILALARPQIKNVQNRNVGEGIDIVLCFDVSGSMNEKDFPPSRIAVAKEVAAEFVKARPVDRLALVIYGSESFTMSPLTTNHELILQQIQNLQVGPLYAGTLIGEGLAKSVERLSAGNSKSKVVILLSDGKEEAPSTRIIDPLTALQIAKVKSVKVYPISMTASEEAQRYLPIDRRSSEADEALLQRIAKETGGAYFKASDKEGLQTVYSQIDRLEKSSFERITKTRIEEQYFYLLIAALFFLFLEALLQYTWLRSFP